MQNMTITASATLTMGITESRPQLQSTFRLSIPFILLDGSSHSPITVSPLAASHSFLPWLHRDASPSMNDIHGRHYMARYLASVLGLDKWVPGTGLGRSS